MSTALARLRRLTPYSANVARPERLLGLVNFALVGVLAWQTAGLIWNVAAPIGPAGAPAATAAPGPVRLDLPALVRFDPFNRVAAAAPEVEVAQLGFTLFAVRVGGSDGGAAVISIPNSGQRSFSIGDAVAPGVTLQSVTGDYAVLTRNGATFRLEFPNAAANAPSQGAGIGDLRIARTIDPLAFIGELALQARLENGEVTGYTLREGSVGPIARRLGLRAGDTLIAVNNHLLSDDERLAELQAELTSRPEHVIRYERDGETRTATVRIETP